MVEVQSFTLEQRAEFLIYVCNLPVAAQRDRYAAQLAPQIRKAACNL